MKPKAFWTYTFLALTCVLAVSGICAVIMCLAASERTAEYRSYEVAVGAYESWYAERKLDPRQVRFDEVLAGRAPADSIQDASLRKLAVDLRMLAVSEADLSTRAKTISALFIDGDGGLGIRAWISCKDKDGNLKLQACTMHPTVATIGNPERLATLLGSDEAAKSAALPHVPAEFRDRPVWNGGSERRWPLLERVQEIPQPWLALGLWIVGSCVFAAFFFLAGYAKHRSWRSGYPNPFASVPHFLLGWIVYLAMLPGVLLMQAMRIVGSDAEPTLRKIKHAVAGRTFASEHERILAQLENIETRAAGRPDSDATLTLIRDAIAKVKKTQNLEELDKLREVAEGIKLHYEVQEELREAVS